MTYTGNSSRTTNRVMIALVVVTIAIVAFWATNGGLDEIQVVETETPVVVSE